MNGSCGYFATSFRNQGDRIGQIYTNISCVGRASLLYRLRSSYKSRSKGIHASK